MSRGRRPGRCRVGGWFPDRDLAGALVSVRARFGRALRIPAPRCYNTGDGHAVRLNVRRAVVCGPRVRAAPVGTWIVL